LLAPYSDLTAPVVSLSWLGGSRYKTLARRGAEFARVLKGFGTTGAPQSSLGSQFNWSEHSEELRYVQDDGRLYAFGALSLMKRARNQSRSMSF
jgi:hypothetical protein